MRRFAPATPSSAAAGSTRAAGAYTIVGVVADSIYNAFGEPPTPIMYFSYRDRPARWATSTSAPRREQAGSMPEVQRRSCAKSIRSCRSTMRCTLYGSHRGEPDLPAHSRRGCSRCSGRCCCVLAAIGIYAVVAYAVSLRTTEIGVRLALGATGRRSSRSSCESTSPSSLVGALGGWLVVAAVVIDVLSAPLDPVVFAGVPALLLLVGTLASWCPARRATRVDPNLALRQP